VSFVPAMQGRLGLELAREHRPDIVLLDLQLPDLQGHEVLIRLKAEPATRDTPVVVLSADASPGQMGRLRAAGAAAFLTKPLDVQELLDVVGRCLAGRAADGTSG
jgi:CheY-like chemotaxis protein